MCIEKLYKVFLEPSEVFKKPSFKEAVIVTIVTAIIIGLSTVIPSLSLQTFVTSFLATLAIIIYVALIIFVVGRVFNEEISYLDSWTIANYSSFVISIALLTFVVLSYVFKPLGMIAIIIAGIVALPIFAHSLAIFFKGLVEVLDIDYVAALILATIVVISLLASFTLIAGEIYRQLLYTLI